MQKSQVDETSKSIDGFESDEASRIQAEQAGLKSSSLASDVDSSQRLAELEQEPAKSNRKLIDYTKSPAARGKLVYAMDGLQREIPTLPPTETSHMGSRPDILVSEQEVDTIAKSDQNESADKIEFFLKVPTSDRRRRRSDPDVEKGRIHQCQVMQELRGNSQRRKSSLRKQSYASKSGGNISSCEPLNELNESDEPIILGLVGGIDSSPANSSDSTPRRQSGSALERGFRGRHRSRSSIIKRSIESLATRKDL